MEICIDDAISAVLVRWETSGTYVVLHEDGTTGERFRGTHRVVYTDETPRTTTPPQRATRPTSQARRR